MSSSCAHPLNKRVIYAGKGDLFEFGNNWKVLFHYQAKHTEENGGKVIDDSRKPYPDGYGQPLELVIGKKFKVPIWERCLQSMRIGEVAQFSLEIGDLLEYPFVSKQLRDISKSKSGGGQADGAHHHCGAALMQTGLGYSDLDEYLKSPQPLLFTFELLKVENPDSYDLASWQLTPDDKRASIPVLRESGNDLFRQGDYAKACDAYSEALTRIEALLLDSRPGDPDWQELDDLKIPLFLNIAQCKLNTQEFYLAIEAANEVLHRDPKNVKGLFRRAKALGAVWEFEDAKRDFEAVALGDKSLAKTARYEILKLEDAEKQKTKDDAEMFKKVF